MRRRSIGRQVPDDKPDAAPCERLWHNRSTQVPVTVYPAQIFIQLPFFDQFFDVCDSFEFRSFEFLQAQADTFVGLIELLDAAPRRPLRFEIPQHSGDLVAVHTVAALVGSRIGRVFDPAARHHLTHDLRDVADLLIFRRGADVKGLIVDQFPGGFQGSNVCPGNVFDVNDWAPR